MSDKELETEIKKIESEKELIEIELDQSKNKWAKYVIENHDSILNNMQPVVVKKKKNIRLKEFMDRLKIVLGFKK